MPKLYLYYSLPVNLKPTKGVISNPAIVYSNEQLTEPVGVMQDYCVHDILDASLITPLVGIKYLPDNKIKVVHLNSSFDSTIKKSFSVEYVANTFEPIETTIKYKQNMPRLQKVVRYITKITETETFGKLELTIK
jgi:hypothetical protein